MTSNRRYRWLSGLIPSVLALTAAPVVGQTVQEMEAAVRSAPDGSVEMARGG
ncbi:MAG: hypothetical protein V3U67_08680 [Gemmatimonadota bacterium]